MEGQVLFSTATEAERASFGNIGNIFDSALNGVEVPEESAELTQEQKERHERWLKRRAEAEEAARKRAEEMKAAKKREIENNRRRMKLSLFEDSSSAPKTNYRRDVNRKASYGNTVSNMTPDEREEARKNEFAIWMAFIDKLNKDNPICFPDSELTHTPDKPIRDFAYARKYLFGSGSAIRPTFIMPDKENKNLKYRVWKKLPLDTTIVEFGSQHKWMPVGRNGVRERDTSVPPTPYFAVRYYSPEEGLKTSLFMYANEEDDFLVLETKVKEYFEKIIPESRKKFFDFKNHLNKTTQGSFVGKLDSDVQSAISTFLRNGGNISNSQTLHLKQGANGVIFDPNCTYLLVNTSHKRVGVLNPQEGVDTNTRGFYTVNGKPAFKVPNFMVIIEFDGTKYSIIYGA